MGFRARDSDFESKVRNSFARQPFMSHLGAEMTVCAPGICEIRAKFKQELTQQHGFFHAGVTGAIVDSACGYAAYSLMPGGSSVLTVEYKLNLIAPAAGEELIARGEVVRAGKTLTVVRGDVLIKKGAKEKICASSLATVMTMKGMSDDAQR